MYKITPPRNNLYHAKVHFFEPLFYPPHPIHTHMCRHIHFSYFSTFMFVTMSDGFQLLHFPVERAALNKPAPCYWALIGLLPVFTAIC